jgi:hypothetical protein
VKIHRATKAIAALGAVTLALAVAGPASAADSAPTDGNGKKYCPMVQSDLSVIWYPDGYAFKAANNRVLVCDDGVWDDDIHARPVGPFGGVSGGTVTTAAQR